MNRDDAERSSTVELPQWAWALVAVAAIAWGLTLALGIRQDAADAAAAFGALGAATTLLALIVAARAFSVAWEQQKTFLQQHKAFLLQHEVFLKDQRRRPNIELAARISDRSRPNPYVGDGEELEVDALFFSLDVLVRNSSGDREELATLCDGLLNVVVLADCMIAARVGIRGRRRGKHRLISGVHENAIISEDGSNVEIRFSAFERDFTAGNDFICKVGIWTPRPGRWPVLLSIQGDPPPEREHAKVYVLTQCSTPLRVAIQGRCVRFLNRFR